MRVAEQVCAVGELDRHRRESVLREAARDHGQQGVHGGASGVGQRCFEHEVGPLAQPITLQRARQAFDRHRAVGADHDGRPRERCSFSGPAFDVCEAVGTDAVRAAVVEEVAEKAGQLLAEGPVAADANLAAPGALSDEAFLEPPMLRGADQDRALAGDLARVREQLPHAIAEHLSEFPFGRCHAFQQTTLPTALQADRFQARRMGKRGFVSERIGSVVAFGASAGGVDALTRVVADLPEDLGAPVLVVLHTGATERSYLPAILGRAGALPAEQARDGARLEPNRIYVAAPDHHLLVADGCVRVVRGPHENGHRPAIDPLFRSAALSYRERAIGVVLSGALDDGAAGSAAISRLGGRVLVQDPGEAAFPDMPRNAIEAEHPHAVLPLEKLGAAVVSLVRTAAISRERLFGDLSPFGCPSCGGVLWEAPDDDQIQFRCRIGHAFGAETLLAAQSQSLDASLAAGLRALRERADLARRVGRRLRAAGAASRAERYDRMVEESERDALAISRVLLSRDGADS